MSKKPPFVSGESVQEDAERTFTPIADSQVVSDSPVWKAHSAVSRFLEEQTSAFAEVEALSFGVEALSGPGNVLGVGVGVSMPRSNEWTAEPGVASLRVYLLEPMEESTLRSILSLELGAEDASSEEMPVETVVTGEIHAFPHTFHQRPAPGGISIGHHGISAGTLGCLARGRTGERSERTLILSNNHVLANTNAGSFGDPILQPGPFDGGAMPGDQVAALESFVPIDFKGPNSVDCATAWADPTLVRPELIYLDKGKPKFFRVAPTPRRARFGDIVGKSGRTTQLTTGRVVNTAATIRVRFGARVALFRDQVEIVPQNPGSGPFSQGGDSGSLIWTVDEERRPIGLLFAGGGSSTFANHIDDVLNALDIDLI